MKHFSIQKEPGWCGVHSLANVLRDKSILYYLEDENYKFSTFIGMNKILKKEGYEIFINPVVNMPEKWKGISNDFLLDILTNNDIWNWDEFETDSDFLIIPFFLTVKVKSHRPEFHSVVVIRFKDEYFYSDPNFENYIKLESPSDILKYFEYCNGIEIFGVENGSVQNFVGLNGENYGFDELLDLNGFKKTNT
jgi:hypothetical protein